MKYRIKIEERKNGDKIYIPQYKLHFLSGWRNIGLNVSTNSVFLYEVDNFIYRTANKYNFDTEKETKEIISMYKEKMEKRKQNKIKTTRYVNV